MIDYKQELAGLFTLSATVHRKVELSLIWAQVAMCKLADLTVVARKEPHLQFRYTAYREIGGQKDYAVFGHCVIPCP